MINIKYLSQSVPTNFTKLFFDKATHSIQITKSKLTVHILTRRKCVPWNVVTLLTHYAALVLRPRGSRFTLTMKCFASITVLSYIKGFFLKILLRFKAILQNYAMDPRVYREVHLAGHKHPTTSSRICGYHQWWIGLYILGCDSMYSSTLKKVTAVLSKS